LRRYLDCGILDCGILDCGILAHGFARARCADCGHDFLIA